MKKVFGYVLLVAGVVWGLSMIPGTISFIKGSGTAESVGYVFGSLIMPIVICLIGYFMTREDKPFDEE